MAGMLIQRGLRDRHQYGVQFNLALENIGVYTELTGSGSKDKYFAEAMPWTKEKLAPSFCASRNMI
jgi:hypothetical protein